MVIYVWMFLRVFSPFMLFLGLGTGPLSIKSEFLCLIAQLHVALKRFVKLVLKDDGGSLGSCVSVLVTGP